jgi:hypothetical protein
METLLPESESRSRTKRTYSEEEHWHSGRSSKRLHRLLLRDRIPCSHSARISGAESSSPRNIYKDEYRIRVLAIWTKRAKASGELIANRRVLTRYRRSFGISTETKGVFYFYHPK